MTSSIRNFVEAGSTNPATRLIVMSTRPTTSSPRRGRISVQISGKTAFKRCIFGGLLASLVSGLNLLFDSIPPGLASLLLHCHTSSASACDCDSRRSPVVCSERVSPLSVGAFADFWPAFGPADHAFRRAGLLGLHHLAGDRTPQA